MQSAGGKEKEDDGLREQGDQRRGGRKLNDIFAHGAHHPVGIGVNAQNHCQCADDVKLLHAGDG